MNELSKALNFRHACKVFDENKKIPDEQIKQILSSAIISPSSFGMEGWKFLVITNDELKAKIRPHCWDQIQITSCSHLVIVLAAIENLKPSSLIPQKRFARRALPQDKIDAYVNLYANHLKDVLSDDEKIYQWSARQTYIALANMMSMAASLKIDSCPIEGFSKNDVEKVLNLDTKKWQLSVIVPFGYRINEQPNRQRLSFDEVVEFIK